VKYWFIKQFNYYWDAFFTYVDTKQLLIWYRLKQIEKKWEYEDVAELDNYLKNMENYNDWEDIE